VNSIFDRVPADFRALVIIVCILAATFLAVLIVNRVFNRLFTINIGKGRVDRTSINFIRRLSSTVIYIIGASAALIQIPEFKIIGHSLLAGAGILTVVGGLASQQVLSNLISGILIVFFRPFKVGDKITINNSFTGIVEDINLRDTILRDIENNRVIIPNSKVSSQVLVNANHTDDRICKFIDIGIGYSSDVGLAMAIMSEEIINHPLHIDNRTPEQKANGDPVAVVRVISIGDSSVNLRAWAWAANPGEGFVLQCDLLQNIKRRFDQENIEIPFPQTTVSFAGDGPLAVSTVDKVSHTEE
jgi:small conductance mechanosensitive channel